MNPWSLVVVLVTVVLVESGHYPNSVGRTYGGGALGRASQFLGLDSIKSYAPIC